MNLFLQLIKQILFWILFFILNRIIFLSYHFDKTKGAGITDILATFYQGLYLDLSTACYVSAIPFFLIFLQSLFWKKVFFQINRLYSFLMIIVISILVSSELGIYDEWGTKLNAKALMYLEHPAEIVRSATSGMLISGTLFILLQSFLGIFLFIKVNPSSAGGNAVIKPIPAGKAGTVLFFLLSPGLLLLGLRGGWQPIPIHQSDLYFSKNNFINNAAVNSSWNMIQSIVQNSKNLNKNPYEFFSNEDSKKIVGEIYEIKKDTTEKILMVNRPNVVLFILEGWSADVIESLGGESDVAPEFEKLASEGILFTNCYSSGERSEQGMAAILSGFPAQPNTSIIAQPSKYPHLSSINSNFLQADYATSFMFGGQLNYGNIKGFIYYSGFHKILEGKDFPGNIPQQRLGVPDEFLFERNINELKNEKQPFFSVMYTLSSHAPYDQPMEDVIQKGGEHKKYLNSVFYSDRSLGEYFRRAKEQEWYKNTLFIIVADHSHPAPSNRDFYEPANKKIPLLLYGEVLKSGYKGLKIGKVVSQTDIPATLLAQLGMNHEKFTWSKNIFNPYAPEFAYYTFFTDGFGWIEKDGFAVYRNDIKDVYKTESKDEQTKEIMIKRGKAFLQALFQEYLSY